ncbi:Hypothetical protein R9X50_00423500 [Acrodontium crateriforme]|uniref:Polyketide synthase-like phosphopantetheine-binding domain-containing protein n=1 Tax=Acrodontium crateriforme TaxID=150365 RepID=A0AAQ3M4Y7_9PEZI|nr:Hypothetical protein R9X50_00423500 [Acrodontium crateriforme]
MNETQPTPSTPASDAGISELALYPVQPATEARTLVDILEATIAAHPTALALDNGTERLTYAQLKQKIDFRVEQLHTAGVGAGDRVGVRITSGTTELYIVILAIQRAAAAYVPVDVDDPEERASLVWEEAQVCAVLTDGGVLTPFGKTVGGKQRLPALDDDAWIIFTSGSTGKPKGVAVTHRNGAAFVDAEALIFLPEKPLGPGDRVLAGLSVVFDASVEEMWLAWRHGACLVPAPRSLVKSGPDLGAFLIEHEVSVVSTVPAIAALWPVECLRGLRLLITGGEALTSELADRLTTNVPVVWNTYGPTEATVVACGAIMQTGQPVGIGLPLAGYKLAVVGPDGQPVCWGESGELVIGGVGVARYLDLEKDNVKFAPATYFGGERAYRTGDMVRAQKEGLFFVGRDDEQIKLGGRRIELGEIDAALMKLPGVTAAASTIQKSQTGAQVLVGYVVRNEPNTSTDRDMLQSMLPATLVPMLVTIDKIPVKISGKVDRKSLPWPPPRPPNMSTEDPRLADPSVAWLTEQWQRVLGVMPSPGSNFFEVGGTSLGAAQLISQLRQRCPALSVADVYEYPILVDMASRVANLSGTNYTERHVKPVPRHVFLFQLPILYFCFTFEGLRWLAALALTKRFFVIRFGAKSWAGENDLSWWLVAFGFILFITVPGRILTTAGVVRILTLGIRPGTYKRGGATHIRLWAAERFIVFGRLEAIAGTPWARYYARLLGCEVGSNVQLHCLPPATGLAKFGTGCAIEPEADLAGWWLDGNRLHIGSITVEEGARVGGRTTLMPNAVVEAFANVQAGICVNGTFKGPGVIPSRSEKSTPTGMNFLSGLRYTSTLLLLDFLPILMVAPIWALTRILVHDYRHFRHLSLTIIAVSSPGAVLGFFLYAATIILFVRLASSAIRPGTHSWHSSAAWASWLVHFLMMDSRQMLFPIFASLFTPRWLKLLGAKIGPNVESSTIVPIPSLLEVDEGCFLADDVLISPFEIQGGDIRLGISSFGARTFIGNSAIIDGGVHVPDSVLIGVLGSVPHANDLISGSSWLGRPPMSLPRRCDTIVDESLTYKPPMRLKLARACVESCRLIPVVIAAVLTSLVSIGMLWIMDSFGVGWAILAGGGLLFGSGLVACLITTFAKWILTPSIHPGQQTPLWSSFVWRNELADVFVQSLAVPLLARHCYGTPLLSMWMRSLGAKIGRGVWLESHLLPEAELCSLGDGATVNRKCILQTHLFHDRIMRLDTVKLEAGATLGPYSITLPGTVIGAGTTVAPTSLVMRGEHIPSSTRWIGNPVRPWIDEKVEISSASSMASSTEKIDLKGEP